MIKDDFSNSNQSLSYVKVEHRFKHLMIEEDAREVVQPGQTVNKSFNEILDGRINLKDYAFIFSWEQCDHGMMVQMSSKLAGDLVGARISSEIYNALRLKQSDLKSLANLNVPLSSIICGAAMLSFKKQRWNFLLSALGCNLCHVYRNATTKEWMVEKVIPHRFDVPSQPAEFRTYNLQNLRALYPILQPLGIDELTELGEFGEINTHLRLRESTVSDDLPQVALNQNNGGTLYV